MPAPPMAQALVERAKSALRRVTDEVPGAARAAHAAAEEIETSWRRTPYAVVLSGEDVAARTELLNFLAGDAWFSSRRAAEGALLVLRRGSVTSCRVRRQDGTVEEYSLGDTESAVRALGAAWKRQSDAARSEVEAREAEFERARRDLPAPLRERPPRWAFWRWLLRWVCALFCRREQADYERSAAALGEARARLPAPGTQNRSTDERRRRFVKEVHALTEEPGRDGSSERITVELPDGPLPSDVAVIDLPIGVKIDRLQLRVDGCLLVCDPEKPPGNATREFVESARAADLHVLAVTRRGAPSPGADRGPLRHVGDFADAASSLRTLCAYERALRLARRADAPISEALASLEQKLERAEAGFEERLERVRARRISDPAAYKSEQLERIRPLVSQRVHLLIEQATVELSSQLSHLFRAWLERVDAAPSTDSLKQVVARIDKESPPELEKAREHAQRLATASLAGAARDLHAELLADLRERAAIFDRDQAPSPLELDLAPSLAAEDGGTRLGAPSSRLSSLFRSLRKVKEHARERLEERRDRLRQVAAAELLDAEHELFEAVLHPLGAALEAALERYQTYLDETLEAERAAISLERAEMKPLRELREALCRDRDRLQELTQRVEAAIASPAADGGAEEPPPAGGAEVRPRQEKAG